MGRGSIAAPSVASRDSAGRRQARAALDESRVHGEQAGQPQETARTEANMTYIMVDVESSATVSGAAIESRSRSWVQRPATCRSRPGTVAGPAAQMPPAGRLPGTSSPGPQGNGDDHPGQLVGVVPETVQAADRHVGERARLGDDSVVADLEGDLAFQDVERLFFPAVDVRRGTATVDARTASNMA